MWRVGGVFSKPVRTKVVANNSVAYLEGFFFLVFFLVCTDETKPRATCVRLSLISSTGFIIVGSDRKCGDGPGL